MMKGGKDMSDKYNKYDVIFGDFPDVDGSKQSGYRPAIVMQNNIGNKFSPTLIVLPLTKKIKNVEQPTHTVIQKDIDNGLSYDSMLLAEQITTIDKTKVKKVGKISNRELQKSIFKCYIYAAAYGDFDEDLKELQIG